MIGVAAPTQEQARRCGRRRQQPERGRAVGRVSSCNPFLPIVHAVAVRVGKICRAVGAQAVLLEPTDERAAGGGLEFVGPDIHSATRDTRAAIQVSAADSVAVIAGVDARGVGAQTEISGNRVHEERVRRPTMVLAAAGGALHDAVIQRAIIGPAAAIVGEVAGQRAVVQSAMICPAAVTGRIVVERAPSPAASESGDAEVTIAIGVAVSQVAVDSAVVERAAISPTTFTPVASVSNVAGNHAA